MPSAGQTTTLDALKQLYASEGKAAVEEVIKQIVEHMATKCERCGAAIYGSILWHMKTDTFNGIACESCQRVLLGPSDVTYFDRYGNVWT